MASGQERFLRPLILPETHLKSKKFKAHNLSWVHFVLLGFGLEEDKAKPQTLKSMDHDKCLPASTLSWAVQGLSASGEKQSTPLSCQRSGRQRPVLKSVSFFNKEWGREASQGAGLPEVPTKHP